MSGKDSLGKRIDKLYPSDGTLYLLLAPLSEGETPYREGNMVVGSPSDVPRFLTPKERNGHVVVFGITEADKNL